MPTRDPVINLYARVFEYAGDSMRVPTPQAVADFISSREWPGLDREWLANMVARLRGWDPGRNYPLIPDDDAMRERYAGGIAVELMWWEPGAIRGDQRFTPLSRDL